MQYTVPTDCYSTQDCIQEDKKDLSRHPLITKTLTQCHQQNLYSTITDPLSSSDLKSSKQCQKDIGNCSLFLNQKVPLALNLPDPLRLLDHLATSPSSDNGSVPN